ncbi:MAG: hypothetical protein JL50_08405 [Peptococcaceae bacterium BICA1-7]|nr:MAG: hypothetical protein JL50_08405 [Peptococcaceae bacterium BICA1-7]HBV97417.1 hypothetical protein [Desulfotomaculum sp.]
MPQQSLCPSYVLNVTEQKENIPERKSGIKCNNMWLKNGELVLAVARYIILNPSATSKSMSAEFSATVQAVNRAIKKIREKLDGGQYVLSLEESEIESLCQAMESRDELLRGEKAQIRKNSRKKWNDIKAIMREHVVKKMFCQERGVAEIAKMTGLKKDDIKRMIEGITGQCIDDIAKELFSEGKGIPEIVSRLDIDKKDVGQLIGLLTGRCIGDIAREMYRKDKSIFVISAELCTPPKDIKKMLPRVIRPPKSFSMAVSEIRRISTIKPGTLKGSKKIRRKRSSISTTKLAHWNNSHYVMDENGKFVFDQSSVTGVKPADLPWKYPSPKMSIEIRGTATGISAKDYIFEHRR